MKKTSIRVWITRYFIVVMIVATVLSALAGLEENRNIVIQQDEKEANICANNIQSLLNHQWGFEELKKSTESDAYRQARTVLKRICETYELDYIYVYTIDTSVPSRYYYLCAARDPEMDEKVMEELALKEDPADSILEGEAAILSGSRELQKTILRNGFGDEVTFIAPYLSPGGELLGLIGMDYSITLVTEDVLKSFLRNFIPFTLLMLFTLLFLLLQIQRRIVGPIRLLSEKMTLFAHNTKSVPEPVHIKRADEIGEIAVSFKKMTEDLSSYVTNIEALTREKVETDVQLTLASRIQSGLVPERTVLDAGDFHICAVTRPARAVGGDFYDCFTREDNSFCFFIGDVSGKGVTAAIFMAMVKTAIREKLIAGLSPAQALNQINRELAAENPENLFATAFAAVLNTATGELGYTNAGHTYPVWLKEEPELLIPDSGIALGMFEDAELTDQTLQLAPGDGILLYTDGLTEAVSVKHCFFGEERLLEAVRNIKADERTAEGFVSGICTVADEFSTGSEPFDDRAVLTLIRSGEDAWQSIPVALSSLDVLREAVFRVTGETPRAKRILLACDEALTNIVNYSGAGELAFSCSRQEEALRVSFRDDGIAFDPTAHEAEEKDFEKLDSGGMGLNLIRQTASELCYERKDGRNEFTLYFESAQKEAVL